MLLAACLYTPHSARNQRAVITNSPSSSSSRSSRHTQQRERRGPASSPPPLSVHGSFLHPKRPVARDSGPRRHGAGRLHAHSHTGSRQTKKKPARNAAPTHLGAPHTHTQGSAVPVAPILYMYVYTRCKNKTTTK